ncbi:uncharacterized protein [Chironomus tepperi]|uniref:uncharacterized protein isoform X2 n=1 Tax=Chironomus tepperi TaxID=113505 RepID=UPI00391F2600
MASHQHAHGNSENVLGFTKDNKVFINDEPLKKMFLHPDVKNRKIVAFSIIGAYRKGKSFFLDYCLRYLYAHYPSINNPKNSLSNPTDWLGDENEPLSGFSWRSGTDRDTTGIVMWNDVFLHKDEATGNEIAIIVVDTHGLFDNVTSSMDNSRIFTLDILISSIQVFNLSGVIQDDHLQFLQSAIECAKFASKKEIKKDAKYFQNLVFLIRDWNNTEEFYYGIDDGQRYWNHFIGKSGNQKVELAYICESILNSYDNVSCALFPHPGKSVGTGSRGYNGSWKKFDEDFTEELDKLVDHLLKPENLVIKKVNGSALNGDEFYEYLNGQLKVFEKDELLQSQSLLQSMTMKEMEILLSACIEHYKQVGNEHRQNIQNECEIPLIHEKSKEAAMTMYNEAQKMGSAGEHENYRKVLDRKIEEIFKDLMQQHEKEKRRLKEEKEKLEKEMEEKQRKELERIQKEKEAAEAQLEKVKQESKKALELENQKKQQELDEITQKLNEECAEIEKRKEVARQAADDQIKAFHDKVEETRIEVERSRREQNSSEESNQKMDVDMSEENVNDSQTGSETSDARTKTDNHILASQNNDMKHELGNESSKQNNSQMQTIVAEKNAIKIEKSKSYTTRSNDTPESHSTIRKQKSIMQNPQISNENCDKKPNVDPQMQSGPANVNKRNSCNLSNPSSTIDNKQTASKGVQSNYNHRLVKVPSGGSYPGGPSTSKSTEQQQRMMNDKEVKKNKMSKNSWKKEVNCDPVDRQPVASTSTHYKVDTGSSYEVAEYATSLSSNRKHRQDYHLDNTTMNMIQSSLSDVKGGSKLAQPVPNSSTHEICNSPIKLITYSEKNESVINTDELTKIFGNDAVKNRKIVAVLITGDEGYFKTLALNSCLDFLYRKYESLYKKYQNRWNNALTPDSRSVSLEMWNDVFLHNNDDIAIVLMNIHGLFGPVVSSLSPNYCLKMFQLASIISSIQVINKTDFNTENRWAYLNMASKLKQYLDSRSKGIKENSKDSKTSFNCWKTKYGSKEDISDPRDNMFLPYIFYADFNKTPGYEITTYLYPNSLITKEVNGLKLTGSEFQQMIAFYHDEFQKYSMPSIMDIYSIIMSYQIEIYLQKAIDCYNAYMNKHQSFFNSKVYTEELHKIAVQNAKIKLEDLIRNVKELECDRDFILAQLESKLEYVFKNKSGK